MWKDQRMLWIENYYDLTTFCPLNYNLETNKFAKFHKTSGIVALLPLIRQLTDKYCLNENCIVEKVIELCMLCTNF